MCEVADEAAGRARTCVVFIPRASCSATIEHPIASSTMSAVQQVQQYMRFAHRNTGSTAVQRV